ncbi:MAG: hypothetical protein WA865_16000 [Spirulinaceae cyanobacterium]
MADLSGTWLGTYWQRGVPTRFELTLVQGGNTLRGNILDDGPLGEAAVVGEVVGRRVDFTKSYLSGSRYSISYTGTVSEDEDSLGGQWQLDYLSGSWEAHRSGDNLVADLASRVAKKEPVSLGF